MTSHLKWRKFEEIKKDNLFGMRLVELEEERDVEGVKNLADRGEGVEESVGFCRQQNRINDEEGDVGILGAMKYLVD